MENSHIGAKTISRGIEIPSVNDIEARNKIIEYLYDSAVTQTVVRNYENGNSIALCFFTSIMNLDDQNKDLIEQSSKDSFLEYVMSKRDKLSEQQCETVFQPFVFGDLQETRGQESGFQSKGFSFIGGCPIHLVSHATKNLTFLNPKYNFDRDLCPIRIATWFVLQQENLQPQNIVDVFSRCVNHRFNILCKHREMFERRALIAQFLSSNQAIETMKTNLMDMCSQYIAIEYDFKLLYMVYQTQFIDCTERQITNMTVFESELPNYYQKICQTCCLSQSDCSLLCQTIPQLIHIFNQSKYPSQQNIEECISGNNNMISKQVLLSSLNSYYQAWESLFEKIAKTSEQYLNAILQVNHQATQKTIQISFKQDVEIKPVLKSRYEQQQLLEEYELNINQNSSMKKRKVKEEEKETRVTKQIIHTPIATNISHISLTSHAICAFLEDPLLKSQGGVEGVFSILYTGCYDDCVKVSTALVNRFKNMIPVFIIKSTTFHHFPFKQASLSNTIQNQEKQAELQSLKQQYQSS